MCLQCFTDPIVYEKDDQHHFIPHYVLMRATKNDTAKNPQWKKDEWGIVNINDPDVFFTGEIVSKDDERYEDTLWSLYEGLDETRPVLLAELICSAVEEGFQVSTDRNPNTRRENSLFRLAEWLMERMYNWLQQAYPVKANGEDEYDDELA